MTIDELKSIVETKFKDALIERNKLAKDLKDNPSLAQYAITQTGGMIIAYSDILKTIDPNWKLDPDFKAY
jgi:hypothetical protein